MRCALHTLCRLLDEQLQDGSAVVKDFMSSLTSGVVLLKDESADETLTHAINVIVLKALAAIARWQSATAECLQFAVNYLHRVRFRGCTAACLHAAAVAGPAGLLS